MLILSGRQRLVTLVFAALCPLVVRGGESTPSVAESAKGHTFDVRDYGARGDGQTLDTAALNSAIEVCSKAGGGQVRVPPGKYLSGTIHLRSHVTLCLEAGAVLMGTTNLVAYEQPEVPSFMPEAKWGKWHRALLVGENLEQVTLIGPGLIDGQKVYDPTGEEHMRGPHTINFVSCKGVTLRDFSIVDSANYAIFFQLSDNVEIRGLTITGGWDGVHFRGGPGRPCRNVDIIGCRFYTGDDSIAGRYWENVVISGCILNSSCNGLRLIGPATRLLVDHCLFCGPGRRPHRSGGRTNMLAGIILQPGAWDRTQGLLDDVVLSDNTMNEVAAPVTVWTKPGNPVGRITVSGLNATGVYRSALSFENWGDAAISNVVVRNASIEFAGGGTEAQGRQAVSGPGVDPRALPAWGVYARNVQQLTLEDVRLSLARSDQRPVMRAEQVEQLTLDNVRFTHVPGVAEPLVQTNVAKLILRDTPLSTP
jgi:polygalacturonase